MNSGSLFLVSKQPGGAFPRQWRQWRRLLAQCGKRPGRGRVHELRVATLRLEALLEFWLRTHAQNAAAKAVKRWRRQADKLREALQQARSPEVYARRLAWLRGHVAAGGTEECLRRIAKLERGFVRQRQAAEKRLVEEIGRRGARLERQGKEVERAIASPVERGAAAGAEVVRSQVADLAKEFPAFTAECLHEFRKRVKSVRYVAEFLAESDPYAARQAEALGKMQAAIGEWRDWHLLRRKARRFLKGEKSVLPELLAAQEAKSLRRALGCCRRAMAQVLHDDAVSAGTERRELRRMPAQRAEPHTASKSRRA